MARKLTLIVFCCLLGGAFLQPFSAHAGRFESLSARIGPSDAIAVAAPDGTLVFAGNEKAGRIPASTLKVLTALVAFDRFGPDYRFATEFYLDPDRNLIIKGYGDPFLVSENVRAICQRLSEQIESVNDLVMDATYFEDPARIPGTQNQSLQPYDAPIGALCVNFNTVFFKKENGRYVSAEPQTPLLPTAEKRLCVMDTDRGRILLSPDKSELTQYAGELFRYFLLASGVQVNGTIRNGRARPETDQLLYRHLSNMTLREVVRNLMEYSNNFIANQLLMAAGADAYGPPATLEKGLRAARCYSKDRLGIEPVLVEGSGISRENRVSAAMFLKILDAFSPYHELMHDYGGIRYKTGTLSGIQTRVGYIPANDGKLNRFVVLINTPGKPADPIVRMLKEQMVGE